MDENPATNSFLGVNYPKRRIPAMRDILPDRTKKPYAWNMKTIPLLMVGVGLTLSAFAAEEGQREVKLDAIPAAASLTLQKLSAGAKLEKIIQDTEDGKVTYAAKITKDNFSREVSVDPAGQVVSDVSLIALADAPAPVRASIEAAAKGGKIETIKRTLRGDKEGFEALILANGQRQQLQIAPDGTVTLRENKSEDRKVE
jgi:hypothetical protein